MITKIRTAFNCMRALPVYYFYIKSNQNHLMKMDLDRWSQVTKVSFPNDFLALTHFLAHYPEFRNLFLHRISNPTRTTATRLHGFITRHLWKPMDTLYLCTSEIGGGLFIQHGFATIVNAKRIGKNCSINQQVTIGYNGMYNPIIEDNVSIQCGAKVLGNVTMHNGSIAGANAVVVKDVPEKAIVGGIPARLIKYRD